MSHPYFSSSFAWLLNYLGLFLLLRQFKGASKRQAGLGVGLVFSLVFFFWLRWMAQSPYLAPFAELAAALTALSLGASVGIWCLVFHGLWKTPGSIANRVAAAMSFSALEYSRQFWLCGFPWYNLGAVWVDFCPSVYIWLGPFWSSMPLIWAAMGSLWSSPKKAIIAPGVCLLVMCGFTFASEKLLPEDSKIPLNVAILHSELPLSLFSPVISRDMLDRYVTQALDRFEPRKGYLNLVVTPEGLIPFYYEQSLKLPPSLHLSSEWAKRYSSYFIVGMQDDFSQQGLTSNCLAILSPQGNLDGLYDKKRLVPIAEYFPLMGLPLIGSLIQEVAAGYGILEPIREGINDGLHEITLEQWPAKIALSVCFEETFLNEILPLRRKGANLWVSGSNDAWFPGGVLAYDHFLCAKILAVATGLPLMRATQQGISVLLDAKGKALAGPIASRPTSTLDAIEYLGDATSFKTPFVWGFNELLWSVWALLTAFCLWQWLSRKPGGR